MNTLNLMAIKASLRQDSDYPSALGAAQLPGTNGAVRDLIGDKREFCDRQTAVAQEEKGKTGRTSESGRFAGRNQQHRVFEKTEACKQAHLAPAS